MLISERAYIEACVLVGPNAPEFDALVEKLEEKYWDERAEAQIAFIETDHSAHYWEAVSHHYRTDHRAHVDLQDIPF